MPLYNPRVTTSIEVAGNTYYPDQNGIFEVPDNVINAFKKRGFVDASARLKEIAEADLKVETKTELKPETKPEEKPIAEAQTTKPTDKK